MIFEMDPWEIDRLEKNERVNGRPPMPPRYDVLYEVSKSLTHILRNNIKCPYCHTNR